MRLARSTLVDVACSVITLNHCHLVIRSFPEYELKDLLGSMKAVVAKHINSATQRAGELWQQECYDRILRDEEHLYRVVQYIGRNPCRSGLTPESCRLWLDPEWQNVGWRFDS